jgi:hypothetical protein
MEKDQNWFIRLLLPFMLKCCLKVSTVSPRCPFVSDLRRFKSLPKFHLKQSILGISEECQIIANMLQLQAWVTSGVRPAKHLNVTHETRLTFSK